MKLRLRQISSVLLVLPYMLPAVAASAVQFHSGWEAHWQADGDSGDGACVMSLPLSGYGEARFVATDTGAPWFELQVRKDMHRTGPVAVALQAPAWHPGAPSRSAAGTLLHIDGGGMVAAPALAARMLLALRDGMHLVLQAPTDFDRNTDLVLELAAMQAQGAFDDFTRCAHTRINVAWHEISRTRITYEVDRHTLDAVSRERLLAVARFVRQDPSVGQVFIDGHTDSSGNEQGNYLLSRRRAETVAQCLIDEGVAPDKLVVRYHGAQYPVADNDSPAGKALNRRTTIRLERDQVALQ